MGFNCAETTCLLFNLVEQRRAFQAKIVKMKWFIWYLELVGHLLFSYWGQSGRVSKTSDFLNSAKNYTEHILYIDY